MARNTVGCYVIWKIIPTCLSSRNFGMKQPRYWCPELKADDPAKKGVCSNYLCDSKPGEDVKLTGPTGKAMLMPEKDASTRDRNESKSGLASPIFFCQTWQIFSTHFFLG